MQVFGQLSPYIYGTHTSVYKKLNMSQFNAVVLLVDEHTVLNFDDELLPKSVVRRAGSFCRIFFRFVNDVCFKAQEVCKKLKYFNNPQVDNMSRNLNKYDFLLKTGPIRAFQDAVMTLIGDYHQYLTVLDEKFKTYKVNNDQFFQTHDVSNNQVKWEFFKEFRRTQMFEEVRN
jgi:hypothetical protein